MGVVVASDSRVASGISTEEVRKLKSVFKMRGGVEYDLTVVSGA